MGISWGIAVAERAGRVDNKRLLTRHPMQMKMNNARAHFTDAGRLIGGSDGEPGMIALPGGV
jgi:hypothetical protein